MWPSISSPEAMPPASIIKERILKGEIAEIAILPIRGMEDFQRQAKTSQTDTVAVARSLIAVPVRAGAPNLAAHPAARGPQHEAPWRARRCMSGVACGSSTLGLGPWPCGVQAPGLCLGVPCLIFPRPEREQVELFQRGHRCGLMTWRPLHATRTHLALAAHIRSPGNWLACFTQAVNSTSSSSSSSWMSR